MHGLEWRCLELYCGVYLVYVTSLRTPYAYSWTLSVRRWGDRCDKFTWETGMIGQDVSFPAYLTVVATMTGLLIRSGRVYVFNAWRYRAIIFYS
ncbi:hypothetical protein F4821DRAFT_19823 [Hypoxylon rubiginosum]|uniref:Uncharacterized protein n=1 Tax=Hypoxylon rubiginosum TaxID=110542 RepID=A0ACC0DD84_9PEZI|nr:hypothetical protein F4821DRAFT_19823 [Hypoxylon rubiginosum]